MELEELVKALEAERNARRARDEAMKNLNKAEDALEKLGDAIRKEFGVGRMRPRRAIPLSTGDVLLIEWVEPKPVEAVDAKIAQYLDRSTRDNVKVTVIDRDGKETKL